MEILNLTEEDLPELAKLYQQLIPNEFTISKMKEVLHKNRENKNHLLLVAKINGKLVGAALACICEMYFGQCKSFMVIEDVVVDRETRGKGIGTVLMKSLEEYAQTNNCSYIMLITDTDRKDAQNFYTSLGYKSEDYSAFKKHL